MAGQFAAYSTLVVVDATHVFSQLALLTAHEFERMSELHGVPIHARTLEALHRDRVLLPLYGIEYDARRVVARVRARGEALGPGELERVLHFVSTRGDQLREELSVGDLFDPAERDFEPWERTKTHEGRSYRTRQFLYSPYQLLGLHSLRALVPQTYPPPATFDLRPIAASDQERYRRIAVLLSALEAAYRPVVTQQLVGFGFALDMGRWSEYAREFRPQDVLARLHWDAADVLAQAERLLADAHSFDPLREWHDLVGLVHRGQTTNLRGLALLAWDTRVAAEILLIAYERLVGQKLADPLPDPPGRVWTPRHYRLPKDRGALDEVLMRFGLSPHPSVLAILEGEIEESVLRHLLEARLQPGWDTPIRLFSAKGIDRDVTILAEYFAPKTGRAEGESIVLSRPPTRIVVAGDPERGMATAQGRESKRQKWVERLFQALPRAMRTDDIRSQLDGLVEVFVWGKPPTNFEFAHFTDAELANAILEVSQSPDTPAIADLVERIENGRRRAANLRSVWDHWSDPKPTKADVVERLLPSLLERVDHELDEVMEADPPTPVARLLLRLFELSAKTPRRGSVALRLKSPPEEPL